MMRFALAPLFCLLTFHIDANASARLDEDKEALRVDAVYKMNRVTQYDDSIAFPMAELASNRTVQRLKSKSIDTQHALNVLTYGLIYIKQDDDLKTGYYMIDDQDRNNSKVHDAFFKKFTDIFVKSSEPLGEKKPSAKRGSHTVYSKNNLSVYPFSVENKPNKASLAIWSLSEEPEFDALTKMTLNRVETPSIFNYRDIISTFFSQFGKDAQARVTPHGANAVVSFQMNEPISNRTATIKVTTTFGTLKPQHLANKEIPWYLSMTSQTGDTHYKFNIYLNHPQSPDTVSLGSLDMAFND